MFPIYVILALVVICVVYTKGFDEGKAEGEMEILKENIIRLNSIN